MKPNEQRTPAPWHLHRSESGFVIVYSDGENRSHVARLFDSTLCEEHGSIESNARLIASAPELLSALERLAHPMADDEDLDYAREIIAKAKGKA
jgi:hypothetical protein